MDYSLKGDSFFVLDRLAVLDSDQIYWKRTTCKVASKSGKDAEPTCTTAQTSISLCFPALYIRLFISDELDPNSGPRLMPSLAPIDALKPNTLPFHAHPVAPQLIRVPS